MGDSILEDETVFLIVCDIDFALYLSPDFLKVGEDLSLQHLDLFLKLSHVVLLDDTRELVYCPKFLV